MSFSDDFIIRQIEMITQFIAKLLLNKNRVEYIIDDEQHLTQTDLVYNKLVDMVNKGDICKAEDKLFDELDSNDKNKLLLALDFYNQLSILDEDFLEKNNFSKDEIKEGLIDLCGVYGIDLGTIKYLL